MEKVYFTEVSNGESAGSVSYKARNLLIRLIKEEKYTLQPGLAIKLTFGEKGNCTFIPPSFFEEIIRFLKEENINPEFIETNALYQGERMTATNHKKLAIEHGFTQLPVVIADGEYGEEYTDIEINQKHFKKCKIANKIVEKKQLLVLSHFKGHILAGFGGAIKQLAMGCSARGGKLDQHVNAIPKVNRRKCNECSRCIKNCPVDAIYPDPKAHIDKNKCIGCASCIAVCPEKAISFSWIASVSPKFKERLAEYALAAQMNKNNLYINFVMNITRGCDCEKKNMKFIEPDLGILASINPVAIDQASHDMLDKRKGSKIFRRGRKTLEYAEKIGLGSRKYEIIIV